MGFDKSFIEKITKNKEKLNVTYKRKVYFINFGS